MKVNLTKSRALASWLHLNFIIPSVLMKMVGVVRLELTTSCSQSTSASQTAPHPEMVGLQGFEPWTTDL